MGSDWYLEKLKSPHWQRKRCEVMTRDDFTCVRCRSTEKQLHVHHLSYEYGKDPWDYPMENFATLCFECHEEETNILNVVGQRMRSSLRQDKQLATKFLDDAIAEYENILIQDALAERDERIGELEEAGAAFDPNGRYYALEGKTYDEDGNLM